MALMSLRSCSLVFSCVLVTFIFVVQVRCVCLKDRVVSAHEVRYIKGQISKAAKKL